MGRPIASTPLSGEERSRQNIRFARRWVVASAVAPGLAIAFSQLAKGPGVSFVILIPAISSYLAAICLLIGNIALLIRYSPFPSRLVMTSIGAASASVGLLRWNWDGAVAAFILLFFLWAVARTLSDLWFREEDLVSGAAPRAFWLTRS